jgi:hypothetical protein
MASTPPGNPKPDNSTPQPTSSTGNPQPTDSSNGQLTASSRSTIVLGLWLIFLAIMSVIVFVQLFNVEIPTVAEGQVATTVTVKFLIWQLTDITQDTRLIVLVITAGVLGSLVKALGSFAHYIAKKEFTSNWIWFYILHPFLGAGLALMIYLMIRAGFFAPGASTKDLSLFGFIGISALAGLFQSQALEKLKEIATSIFKSAEVKVKGENTESNNNTASS